MSSMSCKFTYRGHIYQTREQAIQHQKAITSKYNDVAARMMKTDDPGEAKRLPRCVIKNDDWKRDELNIYDDICYSAAKQDDDYHTALIDSEGMLVEGVQNQYKWGSGLTIFATCRTDPEWLPGKNLMGKVHMRVRDRLLAEQNGELWNMPRKSASSQERTTKDLETSLDNQFNALLDD